MNSSIRGCGRAAIAARAAARGLPVLVLLCHLPFGEADQLPNLTITPRTGEGAGSFILRWDSMPGFVYRVQKSADLRSHLNWVFGEAIVAESNSAQVEIRGEGSTSFYQLQAQREIFSLEPSWVDSDDVNTLLYVLGQCLPTNASVVINGRELPVSIINTGGVWGAVSLNGLAPGQSLTGELQVIENGTSNVVATLPILSPIVYGTELTAEQLQGPPEDPPASPAGIVKTKTKSNQSNDRLKTKTKSNQSNDRLKTKTKSNQSNDRLKTKTKSNQSNDRFASEDWPPPCTGVSLPQFLSLTSEAGQAADSADVGAIKSGILNISAEPATGEIRQEVVDMEIPGRALDFLWVRTYRSRTGQDTAMGHGWDFSFNVSLAQTADGTVQLRPGNGRTDTFYPNGTNGWARDEYFMEIRDLNGDGMPDVLFADSGRWLFNPSTGNPAPGRLWKIIDRNGNTMTLSYDVAGRLDTIVDDLDRTNTIAYNTAGRIESVTDFSSRTVRYEYDVHGDLVGCVSPSVTGTPTNNDFPGGKTNHYAYTSGFADERLNHNLTSITDPTGRTWLQVAYRTNEVPTGAGTRFDFWAAITLRGVDQTHLAVVPLTPSSANHFATRKAIVCDPVGNVTECFYDSRLRCVRRLEYTGRANPGQEVTESVNRPFGKLRPEDPDTYETRWQWNPDSLCTLETRPRGDRTRFVYERDFSSNASPRKKGDLRVVRELSCCGDVDSDGDGLVDTSERAWHFTHHPDFGSGGKVGRPGVCFAWDCEGNYDCHTRTRLGYLGIACKGRDSGITSLMRKGWDGTIKGNPYSYQDFTGLGLRKGWDGTIKGRFAAGPRQTTSQDGSFSHRAINTTGTGAMLRPGAPGEIRDPLDGGDSFVTSVTDPNGVLTTSDYDANGNRTSCKHPSIQGLDAPTLEFAYNAHGQVTAITNAADGTGYRRVDGLEYYADGPMNGYVRTALTDTTSDPIRLEFEYDARGNPTRIIDPRGNDWKFHPNQLNQCVRFETPTNLVARGVTDLIYDENDNLAQTITELRDAADNFQQSVLRTFEWEDLNRLRRAVLQVAPTHFITNAYFYDGNGNLTNVHSPLAVSGADPGSILQLEYDERGLLFREIAAPGSAVALTNQWNYDPNGNLNTTHNFYVGPNYDRIYAYDGFGRPASITDSMGNVVSFRYDLNDNLIYNRIDGQTNDVAGGTGNRRLAEARYEYDGQNRLVRSRLGFFNPADEAAIGDGESATTFSYAPNGQLTSETDDNNHITRFACDTKGRLSQITDAKTNLLQLAYDAADNLSGLTSVERSDAGGPLQPFARSYAYDGQGRCVRSVDNVGNTNRVVFDSLGRVVHAIDAMGNVNFSHYDDLGRRTLAIADLNGDGLPDVAVDVSQSWSYDDNSRLVSSTDANLNTTVYAHDSLGRCLLVTSADGTAHTFNWDARSNLAGEQDANGTVILNQFDALDRLVRRDIAPGPTVANTTTREAFAYNGLSQVVLASNDVSVVEFSYDSLGNLSGSRHNGRDLGRQHDGAGNCISMTYPSGRVVTYNYDALDQVSSASTPLADGAPPVVIAVFAYEGPGRLGRISRANRVNTRITWNGLADAPNAAGDFGWRQVSGINHQVPGGGAVIDRRGFAYDRNQNKTWRAQLVPFTAVGSTKTNLFEHDPLDRMNHAMVAAGGALLRDTVYQLDGNGNRQVVSSNGVAQPYLMEATIPPGDFQMNQYTVTPLGSQIYDENGNLAARSTSADLRTEYTYDYANRLVQAQQVDSSTGVPVTTTLVSFAYDALGRRIAKTTYPPAPLAPLTTEYFRGPPDEDGDGRGDDLIETWQSGALIDSYVHKLDDGVTLLSLRAGGQPHFYHTDDLGSPLALTSAGGGVEERYDYGDYGEPEFLTSDGVALGTNASPAGNPFLYQNMEWDEPTRFYYRRGANHAAGLGALRSISTAQDQLKSNPRHPPAYFDPIIGRYVMRAGVPLKFDVTAGTYVQDLSGSRRKNGWQERRNRFFDGDSEQDGLFAVTQEKIKLRQGIKVEIGGKAVSGLRTLFERGDRPTQAQFATFLD